MPKQACDDYTPSARIISRDQADAFDAMTLKLLCAEGVVVALMNTFDEETMECMVPGEKLHQALFALSDLISDARTLAGQAD
jgi:hypothetical protein